MVIQGAVEPAAPRRSYIHGKCGTQIVALATDPVIDDSEDCPTCKEVRAFWRETGQLRTTKDTPLADELGMRVFEGKVG